MLKKILKSKFVSRIISGFIIGYLWLINKTCKIEAYIPKESAEILHSGSPAVFPCWHSRFAAFLPVKQYGSFHAITSAHTDGNILQSILLAFDHKPIRGSSRKKAFNAMKELIAISPKSMRLVVTPDGPLGPRYKIKGSALTLCLKRGVPIIPMCYSASHAIVFKTWDRFILPIPFISQIYVEFAKPFTSDAKDYKAELEKIMYKQMQKLDKKASLKVNY